jgi:hypothetical protein
LFDKESKDIHAHRHFVYRTNEKKKKRGKYVELCIYVNNY